MKFFDTGRAALFAAMTASGCTWVHAEITSVPYGGVVASHSGKCLAVEGGAGAVGARIVQASCDGGDTRQMQLQPKGGGYHALMVRGSGQCLGVTRASTAAAAQVVQGDCAASDATQWALIAQDGGYALRARHSGMCLDVFGNQRGDGAALIQYHCKGKDDANQNQTFQFERTVFGEQAPMSIMSQYSGQCADVQGSSRAAGKQLIQFGCKGSESQQWKVQASGDNTVQVVSVLSGMCFDVEAGSMNPGAAVIQFGCHGHSNQQWRLQAAESAWRLVSVRSGMCLALEGAATESEAKLIQMPCGSAAKSALWTLHTPTLAANWSEVVKTDVDAAAAANLPDGKILTWSSAARLDFSNGRGKTYTEILDPVFKTGSTYLVADTGHDMFCPGTGMLPDGRILVSGGSDDQRTSIYNPATRRWSTAAPMNIGRGYQGSVVNPDGTVFTLGGSWSGGQGNKIGELWSENGGWKTRPGIADTGVVTADARGVYRADNQLWLQVVSGGRLLHAGPSKQMNWIDVGANGNNGSITSAGPRGDDPDSMNGSLALFGADTMLKTGGAVNYENSNAMRSAQIIDARNNALSVERVAPMAYPRAYHNSVVLPTGHVMVVGGQTYPVPFSDDNSILVPEMWNPVARVFERMPAMATPRNYHSVALLMEDARVWVGGGGLCGACTTNHSDYEILTPPYLLNADGTPAKRPTIAAVGAARAEAGGTIAVVTTDPVTQFALVRLSSVTHTLNNDQRRIALVAESDDAVNYTLRLPPDSGILVPGYYMLFAINARGVPSVAKTIQVAAR